MTLLLSNFAIFLSLLFWAHTVETRAVPSTKDRFGLERSQRVCLHVECPTGEVCVSRNGNPHCQPPDPTSTAPTQPPCTVGDCNAIGPVCDQFGSRYSSECALKAASCNSSRNLVATQCRQDCYSVVRSRLSSYAPPSPTQMAQWTTLADTGTLSFRQISAYTFPSCESNGAFKQEQCYTNIPNHLFCWCVDASSGGYVQNTFQSGRADCENLDTVNCSLHTESEGLMSLQHGEVHRDSCTIHTCNNGVIMSRPDDSCELCPSARLSQTKRDLFARKAAVFRNQTGWDPGVKQRHALNWYFRRCDRNRGGELTYREFSNCHRRISSVSSDCLDAVFEDCSGRNSDSILPGQWRRCFLRAIAPSETL